MTLKLKAVSPKVGTDIPFPSRATAGSAGLDLRACLDGPVTIAPRQLVCIPTGVAIALPGPEYVALVFARSGLGIILDRNPAGLNPFDKAFGVFFVQDDHGIHAFQTA